MRIAITVSARVAITLAVAIALAATPRRAAGSDDHSQDASKHFHRGVELSEDGDWRAALIEFERAYAIAPNFHVLYDIGQCRYQLREYPGALSAFQRYLADGRELVPPDRRAAVQSDIESLKGRVATLRISTWKKGAEISIDDTVVGTTPLAAPVVVSAGRHKVSASLAGFPAVVQYVDLAGEEALDVALDLGRSVQAPTPAAPVSPARGRSLVPAWVAFGAAAVGVGAGSYFGVMAIENKRDLAGTCAMESCPSSSKPLYDDAQRSALWSTVGFGAAIVGAGVGVAYVILSTPRDSAATTPHVAGLRVVAGAGSIGAEGEF